MVVEFGLRKAVSSTTLNFAWFEERSLLIKAGFVAGKKPLKRNSFVLRYRIVIGMCRNQDPKYAQGPNFAGTLWNSVGI